MDSALLADTARRDLRTVSTLLVDVRLIINSGSQVESTCIIRPTIDESYWRWSFFSSDPGRRRVQLHCPDTRSAGEAAKLIPAMRLKVKRGPAAFTSGSRRGGDAEPRPPLRLQL